jgi:hypothetical protein
MPRKSPKSCPGPFPAAFTASDIAAKPEFLSFRLRDLILIRGGFAKMACFLLHLKKMCLDANYAVALPGIFIFNPNLMKKCP